MRLLPFHLAIAHLSHYERSSIASQKLSDWDIVMKIFYKQSASPPMPFSALLRGLPTIGVPFAKSLQLGLPTYVAKNIEQKKRWYANKRHTLAILLSIFNH